MKLITLDNVSLIRQGQEILDHISCAFNHNQITTIIGPNGSGKTSLIKVILGIFKPTFGSVWIKPKIKIGYMPQRISIDPLTPLTVGRFLNDPSVLKTLGVGYLLHRDMSTLSGGEMQRVLLAYAIQGNPDVLILDEPTQAMDGNGIDTMYQYILDYQKKTKCSVILISHDLNFVMKQTTNVLCLNKHICCSGKPAQISKEAAFLKTLYTHHHDHKHDLSGGIIP